MIRRDNRRSADKPLPLGANFQRLFGAATISNLGDGVGLVAYPWLASATTRDPLLLTLVTVALRLPWLLFSLPSGVVVDRLSRRSIMMWANGVRTVLAGAVGLAVVLGGSGLPNPGIVSDLDAGFETRLDLYAILLVCTFLLGTAEVLYDNAATSILPQLVDRSDLDRANGRLRSGELVANNLLGPPLGAALLTVAFAAPFFIDAATFAVSAVAVATMSMPAASRGPSDTSWTQELGEGLRWLVGRRFLLLLLVMLGAFNLAAGLVWPLLVFYVQETLDAGATEYALIAVATAAGGVLAGLGVQRLVQRFGRSALLRSVALIGVVTFGVGGLTSQWWVVAGVLFFQSVISVIWSVITVSMRQTIIPDELMGRVNSIFRLVSWGIVPIAALIGGLIVTVAEGSMDRVDALRAPWFGAAAIYFLLLAVAVPALSTERIDQALSKPMSAP